MNPVYLATRFRSSEPLGDWPASFAVITAFAPTGELWTNAENSAADKQLKEELRGRGVWMRRLAGYSPTTGHAEDGWAVELSFDEACDIGESYRQDAIYFVEGDDLVVSYCDDARRAAVPVGGFRERVDTAGAIPATEMITVRSVAPADVVRWPELRSALWPDEPSADLAAEASAFFAEGVIHLDEVLVAEDAADGVIGFAELSLRRYAEGCATSPVAFLEGWFVAPSHRGRGIGGALVRKAEEWGRAQGCSEFASDTTVDNTASAAAHRALGFEEVEIIRCFRKSLGAGISHDAPIDPITKER